MTILSALLILGGAAGGIAASVGPHLLHRRRDRRNWPNRLRLDYEVERVRDNFIDHLTEEDVRYLVSVGWEAPAAIVRHWNEVARFRRIATMTPAELDAMLKARAAGFHVTAHPDDLRFSTGGIV